MCVGVKILNFVYFGVKKSGISVYLVSAENGTGVTKRQISRMLTRLIFNPNANANSQCVISPQLMISSL